MAKEIASTYQLQDPVEFMGQEVTKLEFRKPLGKDMRALPADVPTIGQMLDLAGRLSGQTIPFMDALSARDAVGVAAAMGEFLN